MADSKITALTALTTADPATDMFPVVDVSDTTMAASGTTKRISINNILACSPTATLASATITGDLTVRTNKLAVTSTGVGCGVAIPLVPLHAETAGTGTTAFSNFVATFRSQAAGRDATIQFSDGTNQSAISMLSGALSFGTGGTNTRYNIDSTGVSTWAVGGFTAMTLNSTGLGVGVSPNRILDVRLDQSALTLARVQNQSTNSAAYAGYQISASGNNWGIWVGSSAANSNALAFVVDPSGTPSVKMTLDTSGNLGVGVTPSAWSTTGNIQLPAGAGTSGIFSSNRYAIFGSNAYFNSGWKYTSTAAAAMYIQDASAHQWFSAGSGTAGNAITWTQAMTLDASGNLLVGKSSAVATAVGIQFQPLGTSYHTLSASTNSDTTLLVYSTGAAAYRFYVGLGGTVFATNTTISAISDQRLKENIQDIDVGLGAILALKPRKFDWKAGKGKDIKGDRGFIAQEFEQVFPNLVDEWKDNAPEGEAPYKSVRQDLIPVLVKAIQELTARVEALEA